MAWTCNLLGAHFPSANIAELTVKSPSERFYGQVAELIRNAKEIPGVNAKDFAAYKLNLIEVWSTLTLSGHVPFGNDEDTRPYIVGLQAVIEQWLSNVYSTKEIHSLTAIIHTPQPPTPLCTNGTISGHLVNASVAQDPLSLNTVNLRVTTLRNLLCQGATLVTAFTRIGYNNRNDEELKVFHDICNRYPVRLVAYQLDCSEVPEKLSGATYVFTDRNGEKYLFGLNISQANSTKGVSQPALWFGHFGQKKCSERFEEVRHFIKTNAHNHELPF